MRRTFYILLSIVCLIACKSSIVQEETINNILWVSGVKVDCDNDGVIQCLQIQESEIPYIDEWIPWRDSIIGFEPEIGYMYKIKVHMKTLKNRERLTHKEMVKYEFMEVLEKTLDPAITLYDIWGLYSMNGKVLNTKGERPRLELNLAKHKVQGQAFCNQISGRVYTLDNTIKFSKIATTKRGCMQLENENTFIKLLESSTSFKRDKRLMKFYNSLGKEILTFKKLD